MRALLSFVLSLSVIVTVLASVAVEALPDSAPVKVVAVTLPVTAKTDPLNVRLLSTVASLASLKVQTPSVVLPSIITSE